MLLVIVAIGLNALCILPSFLVGAIAHQVQSDFRLNDFAVGVAFSGFWLVASLAAVPCSRLVKRWGAIPSMQVAGVGAGVASIVIPLASHVDAVFVVLVSISGLAPALATPAVNTVIMSVVAAGRQAFALTAAGASPVLSLMLAGFAASAIGESLGWRWVYIINGVVVTVLAVTLFALRNSFRGSVVEKRDIATTPSLAPLIVMMVGVGAGNAAVGAATAFLVVAAPSAGVVAASAALAVAVGSALSIVLRLTVARVVDRSERDPMPVVIALMLCGTLGFILLGAASTSDGVPLAYYAGVGLVLVLGWSWVSLLLYGVLARYREEVASASGVVQMVFFIGGVAGPGAMGLLLTLGSFPIAWWCLAVASVIGAVSVAFSLRRLPTFSPGTA